MPSKTKSFINFDSPAELIAHYDKDILDGKIELYPWQVEVADKFAEENKELGLANELDIVAANESGKSKMLVAPCALWSVCQFDKAETVITTASGSQLDRQTGRYIKDYAARMNTAHGADLWTIQHRLLKFAPTDGMMDLFATDEAGKAEGWHQRDFDSAFTIIVDEAKSVSDEVFTALDRCHDAQRILRVSSPAIGTQGYFYRVVTSGRSWVRKVTAYECSHISHHQISKIIKTYGLHSPITKSIIFAEFSSVDQQVVIRWETLQQLLKRESKPLLNIKDQPIRVGGDLAAGGDENVISIWQGNQQLGLEVFRENDTSLTVLKINQILNKYKVPKNSEYIFMDDGGVGRAMIDQLEVLGWKVQRVLNQSAAINSRLYSNRGAELWVNFASFIEQEELRFLEPMDEILVSQLTNRYYKKSNTGKLLLESKKEAKAHGHPSPDRADATVLAFTGLQAPYFSLVGNESNNRLAIKGSANLTIPEIVEMMDQYKYRDIENAQSSSQIKQVNYSMSALLSLGNGEHNGDEDKFESIREQLNYFNDLMKK